LILPRIIETLFPKSYHFIWQIGWNAGNDRGQALMYRNAEERLDRWELKDLKNAEFKLGYNHARKIALNQLTMKDFKNLNEDEQAWRERRVDGGVDRTTES